jgi:hypothetical protein
MFVMISIVLATRCVASIDDVFHRSGQIVVAGHVQDCGSFHAEFITSVSVVADFLDDLHTGLFVRPFVIPI